MIEQIGPHRVRHGNIMDGIGNLIPGGTVDYIYSDPPWGDGNLKYWQTMNIKNNGGSRRDTSLKDFLDNLFQIIKIVSNPETIIFIEYGQKWESVIESYANKIDLQILNISTPVYGKPPRPLSLFTMAYHRYKLPADYQKSIDNTTAFQTLIAATKPFELTGKTFFDPCCGLGYTARLALKNNGIFYGNELNLSRLDRTKKLLRENL